MRIETNLFPHRTTHALTLSYDDGPVADRRLVETMNRHGIRGSFHLSSSFFGKPGSINASEVASLYKGHEVSAHSATHPSLVNCAREVIVREILGNREALEQLAGYPVRGMSYPFGTYDDRVVSLLSALGIEYARAVVSTGAFGIPGDFMRWHPTCHHNGGAMDVLRRFLDARHQEKMLLYVWGHSYEFDNGNNWHLIEELCAAAGGKSHVWYATSIEIVDYCRALDNLKLSAACDVVYNPSAIPVWVSVDGKAVEVAAGHTMKCTSIV